MEQGQGIIPEMPEGFPVVPAAKYKAILSRIDDRIVSGEEMKWDGKMACWWRFKIVGGDYNGLEISGSTPMPFYSDWTPVEENLKLKCFRWTQLCKLTWGGVQPKGIPWAEFKQKVTGTEWEIETANRKFRGVEKSEVVGVSKIESELPF